MKDRESEDLPEDITAIYLRSTPELFLQFLDKNTRPLSISIEFRDVSPDLNQFIDPAHPELVRLLLIRGTREDYDEFKKLYPKIKDKVEWIFIN